MITFNPETQTFNLLLRTSFYAFHIDENDCLVHLGWGTRPIEEAVTEIDGRVPYETYTSPLSFVTQFRPDEILTFGDVVTHQETVKVSFPSLGQPLAEGEQSHLPLRDLRLRYASHEIASTARPGLAPTHWLQVKNSTPRETLRVVLRDPVQPFEVTLCYRLTPEHDIIERWYELENIGQETITVETCHFASLHLPHGYGELTYVSGAWAREFKTERETLTAGTKYIESRALQTGHHSNPFFMLNKPKQAWEESGTVYFGQLAYSGSWRLAFERLPSWQLRVHGGYNPFDFELKLTAGERHVTPAFICGVSAEGWGGASRRLHSFIRERVLPRPENVPTFRPVLYNSWEATYFDISYDNQVELARKAAAIGVELFCVDDGWFGSRSNDTAGLGDWVARKDVFPEGLEPLVAEVERLGMRFGLWVEPEMINPNSDLYRAHPDWVLHFPGRPRTTAREQLILDFGRTEVVEHIFALLDELVSRYHISFFKWDMNRYTSEPGSPAGKAIWRKHVEGVYSIMDRLRRKHLALEIQSCSGGGARIDAGILGRTDQVWVSDNTDSFNRLHIQEGFSLAYPARTMEAWVTNVPNEITHGMAPLNLRFDVATRGALGIGSSLDKLSEQELDQYASYIAFYKRIRHVIQEGELYRLQRLEEHGASVIQYVLPNGREAVFSLAMEQFEMGSLRPLIPLHGLLPSAIYRITDRHEQELYQLSGYQLMTMGIPLPEWGHIGYSQTLYLEAIEA